ncbi:MULTISPECIES: M48 family metallopeptidase [unclassified Oceanispirochaeta]|uniref:tetratricopeptide repeat protein n=1 Tax=unclassified Oceanispirochaeta TaxID=2635722 RepID=UPI000E08E7AB|nr:MULTISPECIES: tetratricopeptide repeat protein [unclassified Oceanispirochaeta]MBF9018285.1 tetratricopeptide repeat protein [Oceanispirochaeta sp. M2]NPD74750.1 tetratricopeptide repeat protein [Oceanispirochaeta sp. M1]RDG29419.1 tetratricopeptide repeat protein [Oceanispirochaeta sp. M1]
MKNKIIIILILCSLLSATWAETQQEDVLSEYSRVFGLEASRSNDFDEIMNGIRYIDNLLTKNEAKVITSIYYNRAQLYYKLGEYDEAINSLQVQNPINNYYKATLYIKLGKFSEAESLFNPILFSYEVILGKDDLSPDQRIHYLNNAILIHRFLKKSISIEKLSEFSSKYKLSDKERQQLLSSLEYNMDIDECLRGMWPE